jgi:prepilin-type N-terminal cleavage/methylation domain-containing protein
MNDVRDDAGFTLAETLVALALLAFLSVMALNAMSALQSTKRVEAKLDAANEVAAARNHLLQVLSDIRPVYRTSDDGSSSVAFSGEPTSLTLVSVLDDQVVTGGLYEIRYALNNNALGISYRLLQNTPTGAWQDYPLLQGVSGIKFRYYGPPEVAGEAAWVNQWTAKERLPLAIEIGITFSEVNRRWQILTVPVETAK